MTISVKQAIILVNAIGCQITLTSPNPPAARDEIKKYRTRELLTSILWWYVPSLKFWMQLPSLLEIAAISCNDSSAPYCSAFRNTLGLDSTVRNIGITPSFMFGSFLVVVGAALRIVCYRSLGQNFTFQLAIKKDHELVTHGPYALVRHPSYTAFITVVIGLMICQFGAGSLWAECGLWGVGYGRIVEIIWLLHGISLIAFLTLRTKTEDATLRGVFGDKWVAWAARTKYRLVPGIY